MLNGLCQVIPRGVMGRRDILMYCRCLQLARWKGGAGCLWWRRVFRRLCTVAHMWAPSFFSSYFFFFWSIDFPPSQWREKLKRIICSNNHFSVTAGKVACQPIFIGLLERQTIVLNWWTLHYLMLGDHGMNFAEYSFHFKLCHKFFNGLWTRPKHQPTRRYKFCSQMQQLITPSSDRN